ncbi:PREDICTED: putative vomeronasal receptor-like protein 4 [Chinchilla lanigera]|uniref:putative vomeronasal receptor-like protein 4 n=1 Tax=Chinchilla lanigera TaxID=34839 RepID=UPI00038F1027|nr:PREDICTED: putative vomeronasal receptor-like protein 4 [Chinchilla lanigera]
MELNLVRETVFAFLTGLGTMGNISVFVSYALMLAGTEKKCMYLILIHLSFTNIMMLLFNGLSKTVAVFFLRNFLDDISCKIAVYLQRVAQGLSICTTSLLTVLQAVIMSPRHSRGRRLQPRSTWHILPLLLFFWVLNSSIGMNLLHYIKSTRMNTSNFTKSDHLCDFELKNPKIRWLFLTLMVLRDAVFQGLMGGSSVYMVFLLHKHHQRVLHLKSSKFLYKTPPEILAAQSVLLLMLCFLFFYWIECILSLLLNSFLEKNVIINNVRELVTLGYPSNGMVGKASNLPYSPSTHGSQEAEENGGAEYVNTFFFVKP